MKYNKFNHLTDDELISYLDLTNVDPLIERLCGITLAAAVARNHALEDQLSEAEEDAEYYKELYDDAKSEIAQLRQENKFIKNQLDMWNIMKDTNLT